MIKNNLLIRALKKEKTERPPVWIMRQAGRYLPEFMRIKKKYDFFTRCQTPELATEITMLPINEIKPNLVNPGDEVTFYEIKKKRNFVWLLRTNWIFFKKKFK